MPEGIENPRVIYVPISPGFPDERYASFFAEAVEGGLFDAAVIETYMSGGVGGMSYQEGVPFHTFGEINMVSRASQHIPTFLVPQAHQEQKYPRRNDGPELAGGIALETAYSGVADIVVSKIIEVLKRNRDPQEVIAEVREYFRQRQWPLPFRKCREGETWTR
ncbi:hypothetical protein M0P48_00745 [Candidatus Gracilibacteria bacterium]|jgi:hypothetical protein|nr:hypothetical protein [Candidatus Gracilibacteria bacterium]